MAAGERSRGSGVTAGELAAALAGSVTRADWLRYRDGKGPVQKKELLKHAELFGKLAKLSANLSFPMSTRRAAFQSIVPDNVKECEAEAWAECMTTRLGHACRDAQQSRQKGRAWAAELGGPKQAAAAEGYLHGTCRESGRAWRSPAANGGEKEFATKLEAKPDGKLWATWSTGEATATDLDPSELEGERHNRGRAAAPANAWEGVTALGSKLRVARRSDRQLLISLYEQSKQVGEKGATFLFPERK